MKKNICHIVYRWLRKSGIAVSATALENRLSSHPAYPSILSITDTLDNWDIPNAAIVPDKEKIGDLPLPFLISTNAGNDSFQLINNMEEFNAIRQNPELNWNGIVLVIDPPSEFNEPENKRHLKIEKTNSTILLFASVLFCSAALSGIINRFNWEYSALVLLNIAGAFISILIIQQEMGMDNTITRKICNTGKNSDCASVLHAAEGSLLRWLHFSDLGIIWFSAWTIILLVSHTMNNSEEIVSLYRWISLTALPLTFLSIYYQYAKIKKWCTLCLITIAILWLQSIVLFIPGLNIGAELSLLNSLSLIVLITTLVFVSWMIVISPLLAKSYHLQSENYRLLRFKNDPDVFETLLYRGKQIDTTTWTNDLQLGNPDSPIQLLVACNPYCAPCAAAHKILHHLVEQKNIGLTIRFSLKTSMDDHKTKAATHLLQIMHAKSPSFKRMALHRWFVQMNLSAFEKEYPLYNPIDVTDQLQQHERWTKTAGIKFTPTIFINYYPLPSVYTVDELAPMITAMLNKSTTISVARQETPVIQL